MGAQRAARHRGAHGRRSEPGALATPGVSDESRSIASTRATRAARAHRTTGRAAILELSRAVLTTHVVGALGLAVVFHFLAVHGAVGCFDASASTSCCLLYTSPSPRDS